MARCSKLHYTFEKRDLMSYIETNLPRPVTDVIADLSKYIKNIDLFIGIIYFLMSIFFMKIASF